MPPPPYAPLHLHAKVDELVAPHMAAQGTVGLVVGVLRGEERHVFGYGGLAADRDGIPDENTVFEIGSISKVFTANLLAEMIAREEVQLRDPASKYLPSTVQVPTYRGEEITLYHLATHTSSLPTLPPNFNDTVQDEANPYVNYTVEHLYQGLPRCKLGRPLGIMPSYSNLGVGLLGHVLATLRGRSYEELLTERICQPLGLEETTIKLSAGQQTRLARGHTSEGKATSGWDLPTLAGAGALRSTVADLLRYLEANLHPEQTKLQKALEACHTIYPLPRSPQTWRYVGAAGIAGAGLAAQWAIPVPPGSWLYAGLAALPVALSAYFGGLGPGLLAGAVSVAGGRLLWQDDYNWAWGGAIALGLASVLSLRHWFVEREVALGWQLARLNQGLPMLWHNGSTGGYNSWMGFIRESQCAVVVLSNSDHSVDDLGRGLLDYVHQSNEVWADVPRLHRSWNRDWSA